MTKAAGNRWHAPTFPLASPGHQPLRVKPGVNSFFGRSTTAPLFHHPVSLFIGPSASEDFATASSGFGQGAFAIVSLKNNQPLSTRGAHVFRTQ
mgnify:CR=1 FL=1